ncbi:hypothetical protein VN1222_11880 [Helicobacter pylori]|nr:hypothetical protein VN1222_11880 [Helicobacter pylori]
MVHFISSVLVVFLWLVAWGIYLVFGKGLKEEMEGIENSDSNQNNPYHYCCCGYWRSGYRYFFPRYQTNR